MSHTKDRSMNELWDAMSREIKQAEIELENVPLDFFSDGLSWEYSPLHQRRRIFWEGLVLADSKLEPRVKGHKNLPAFLDAFETHLKENCTPGSSAALIVAAPEMLEALEEIHAAMNREDHIGLISTIKVWAGDAIAKAKGVK